jgi:protease I
MSSPLPLAGKKLAVLVESRYIPGEIKIYQERFAGYGATVDFVSRLWGQPKLKFYSTVEPEGENVPTTEWLEVSPDVDDIDPDDYAAVITTANYTSVRLRFTEAPINSSTTADVARRAAAVQFFRRAMQNPRIILESYNRALDH